MSKTILFVEDDADDRELLSEVVKGISSSIEIAFAENGLKAIEYLNTGKESSHLPCLIVLDLNMPFLDGKETYNRIKQDTKLEAIPVIIFTSSHNPNDKKLFTNLGVEFFTKPDEYSYMSKIISHMINVCAKC